MRTIWTCAFVLVVLTLHAKRDSLEFQHNIGAECGGNSPFYVDRPILMSNIYYQVMARSINNNKSITSKIGYMSGLTRNADRLHEMIFESGILFGKGACRLDCCLGYTMLLGRQLIRIKTSGTYEEQYTEVNFYDFLVTRIGLSIFPKRSPHLFFRFGYTPHWILPHNPIPDPSESNYPQSLPRFNPLWIGVSVGVTF